MTAFTIINHEFRKRNGLQIDEYVLLDTVHSLNKKESDTSRIGFIKYLSSVLDRSKQTVVNMARRLETQGWIKSERVDSEHGCYTIYKSLPKWEAAYERPTRT